MNQISMKKWVNIFTFAFVTVRAEVADHPPPPYGQPDRKMFVFLRLLFITMGNDNSYFLKSLQIELSL